MEIWCTELKRLISVISCNNFWRTRSFSGYSVSWNPKNGVFFSFSNRFPLLCMFLISLIIAAVPLSAHLILKFGFHTLKTACSSTKSIYFHSSLYSLIHWQFFFVRNWSPRVILVFLHFVSFQQVRSFSKVNWSEEMPTNNTSPTLYWSKRRKLAATVSWLERSVLIIISRSLALSSFNWFSRWRNVSMRVWCTWTRKKNQRNELFFDGRVQRTLQLEC